MHELLAARSRTPSTTSTAWTNGPWPPRSIRRRWRERFDGPLPEGPVDPRTVIDDPAAAAEPRIGILNAVVLDQVLVRFRDPNGQDDDARTRQVIATIQPEGTTWGGLTRWQGRDALRISVSGWKTADEDVQRVICHAAA